jgi:RNA polymerase sigma factor, sigma-70 family
MNKEITNLLQSNKKTEELYYSYRNGFYKYIAARYQFSNTYILDDIYQDSFMALINTLKKTRINSLKDYLYRIGENNLKSYFKQEDKFPDVTVDSLSLEVESCYTPQERERMREIVSQYTAVLENPCKQVLNLFYWGNKNMDEIAQIMGYKSVQVAKNRKSLCVQKMREVVIKKIRLEGLL